MLRFLRNIFYFILSNLLVIIIPGLVLSSYDNIDRNYTSNSNIISLQNKSKFDSLDILFIGNSYCYSGIQPTILDSFGISSYNLGIASAGIITYELSVNDYLANTQKNPEVIFILISPMTFSALADNQKAYPIHRYLENPISNFELASKYGKMDELGAMYKKSIKKGVKNLLETKTDTLDLNQYIKYRGYVADYDTVSPEILEDQRSFFEPLQNDEWDEVKFERLINLSKNLEKQGIEVVFFELPTYRLDSYFNLQYLISYNKARTRLESVFRFLTLEDSEFTHSYFKDTDHLNFVGARKSTLEILSYLKNEMNF